MSRSRKKEYIEANARYLDRLATQEDILSTPEGVLYRVVEQGDGKSPGPNDVVSVYYKGSLIDGKTFDDNTAQGYPDSFRLRELIASWQIMLPRMREGDRYILYIPASLGYGARSDSDIPGGSTLVFDITLVKVN